MTSLDTRDARDSAYGQDYWLHRCEGFRVESAWRTLNTANEIQKPSVTARPHPHESPATPRENAQREHEQDREEEDVPVRGQIDDGSDHQPSDDNQQSFHLLTFYRPEGQRRAARHSTAGAV
jgi:hypothetical protein